MKKIIAIIIHFLNPDYFINCSLERLDYWGVEDVFNGEIIWIK